MADAERRQRVAASKGLAGRVPIGSGTAQSRRIGRQSRPRVAGEAASDWEGTRCLVRSTLSGWRCPEVSVHRRPRPIDGHGATDEGRTGAGVVDAAPKGGPEQRDSGRRAATVSAGSVVTAWSRIAPATGGAKEARAEMGGERRLTCGPQERVVADRWASFVAPELGPTTTSLTGLSAVAPSPSGPSPHSSVPSPPPSPPFLRIYGLAVTYEGERTVLERGLKEEEGVMLPLTCGFTMGKMVFLTCN
jgi:hypothetical protein